MNKAYSSFVIKDASEDNGKRIIKGIASTITPDRMDDIVEPKGAEFKLPLPLLSMHDHKLPIGLIHTFKPGSKQIEMEAEVSKDTELEYIETAWKQLKAGLVRGLSIGFRALEYAFIKETWGVHFTKWECMEVSAVTIPANAECTITSIKSFDQDPVKRSSVIHLLGEDDGDHKSDPLTKARQELLEVRKILGR